VVVTATSAREPVLRSIWLSLLGALVVPIVYGVQVFGMAIADAAAAELAYERLQTRLLKRSQAWFGFMMFKS
jgi:ornithine cyclodeaminase/alanine dehydrogenase-like protein (mu-crystallin family)